MADVVFESARCQNFGFRPYTVARFYFYLEQVLGYPSEQGGFLATKLSQRSTNCLV
jgi:hypothetical protein